MATCITPFFLLAVAGATLSMMTSQVHGGRAVCPLHPYRLSCPLPITVTSITWSYRCPDSLSPTTISLSNQGSSVINCTNGEDEISFQLLFVLSRDRTISNLTAYGNTQNHVSNPVSLFVCCVDNHESAEEIRVSGSPPSPQNFSLHVMPHPCNDTHYPIMYTWTHPVPNSSYYSVITEYILVLEFQNNETRVVLDANSTGLWVWQEYNMTYNVSLQAKNCKHTERGVASLGIVSRTAFDICCSLPDISSLKINYSIHHNLDRLSLTISFNEQQIECTCGPDQLWSPDPIETLRQFLTTTQSAVHTVGGVRVSVSSPAPTNGTVEPTTEDNKNFILYVVLGGLGIVLLLLLSIAVMTLIIFIRVKISSNKLSIRATAQESVYTNPPSVGLQRSVDSTLPEQPVTGMDEETVQYDDILMTARPQAGAGRLLAGAATGDSLSNHQYAVLTRETPIYSTLYSYDNTPEHNDTGNIRGESNDGASQQPTQNEDSS